jgi:hypothetical protein
MLSTIQDSFATSTFKYILAQPTKVFTSRFVNKNLHFRRTNALITLAERMVDSHPL